MDKVAGKKTGKVPIKQIHVSILLLLVLIVGCAKSVKIEERYQPHKNLLEILSDFRRHLDDNTYRFLVAKDITGKDIYKATLIRLENYEKAYPGYMEDIVTFSKAKAFEKLHDYEKAISNYQKLIGTKSKLENQANKNINICSDFLRVIKKDRKRRSELDNSDNGNLQEELKAFDSVLQRWNILNLKYKGTPYEFLAKEEEEKLDMAKIDFIVKNRDKLPDGIALSVIGYNQLIEKHRESKYIYSHILKFANLYNSFSREYVARNDPGSLSFNIEEFNQLANRALGLYEIVAGKDGISEKIEANGMIKSLHAYVEKIRRANK